MTEIEQFLIDNGCNLARMDYWDFMRHPEEFGEASVPYDEAKVAERVEEMLAKHDLRAQCILRFGFAILTTEVVEVLRHFSPILEVGAGSGYWAYELQKAGIDCLATDPGTGKYGNFLRLTRSKLNEPMHWTKWWTNVEKLTAAEAIKKYPERNLLMVWPDYDEPWPAEALKVYRGDVVLYVGESDGGCTGNDEFHEILNEKFPHRGHIWIPQHEHVHDGLYVHSKKPFS
jgi:hypothetical protein